jgi:hypothetical protein
MYLFGNIQTTDEMESKDDIDGLLNMAGQMMQQVKTAQVGDIPPAFTLAEFNANVKPKLRSARTLERNPHLQSGIAAAFWFMGQEDRMNEDVSAISNANFSSRYSDVEAAIPIRQEFIDYLEKLRECYRDGTCATFTSLFEKARSFDISVISTMVTNESTMGALRVFTICVTPVLVELAPKVEKTTWDALMKITHEPDARKFIAKTALAMTEALYSVKLSREYIRDNPTAHETICAVMYCADLKNRKVIGRDNFMDAQGLVLIWFTSMLALWKGTEKFERLGHLIRKQRSYIQRLHDRAFRCNGARETPSQYRERKTAEEFDFEPAIKKYSGQREELLKDPRVQRRLDSLSQIHKAEVRRPARPFVESPEVLALIAAAKKKANK